MGRIYRGFLVACSELTSSKIKGSNSAIRRQVSAKRNKSKGGRWYPLAPSGLGGRYHESCHINQDFCAIMASHWCTEPAVSSLLGVSSLVFTNARNTTNHDLVASAVSQCDSLVLWCKSESEMTAWVSKGARPCGLALEGPYRALGCGFGQQHHCIISR